MKLPKVDQYFLTRDAPLGKYRRIDMKKVRNWLIGLGSLTLIATLLGGNEEVAKTHAATTIDDSTSVSHGANTIPVADMKEGNFYLSGLSGFSASDRSSGNARQVSASQVVKAEGRALGLGLSSGTSIPAKVLNRIVTTDSRNPVIAVVTEEVSSGTGFSISAGTKVLGNAQGEPGSNRVQVTFHTFVFENGTEQQFSAIAMMPDGSSGIAGAYHSQMLKKESGRFLSNFISGFADGFKDREKGGVLPFEPGNLKNAALNGISDSASEQAKAYGEDMKNVSPYVTIEAGTGFLIFLEKGMSL